MKKKLLNTKLFVLIICMLISAYSFGQKDIYSYSDALGNQGMTLKSSKAEGVNIGYSIQKFSLADRTIEKNVLKEIEISGNFLPNEEGAPNLPSYATYVAVPNGATAKLEIVNMRKEIIKNVDLAAAMDIPFVGQEQAKYKEDLTIYSKNAFYPENPIVISEKSVIRGVEVVTLGITPFQYNPVTKELIVYRDLDLNINFDGGKGEFGENRLRSRFFEPILRNTIMNYTSLPEANYSIKTDSKATGCEYLIVVPDDADFIAWADTIKQFRTLQGIHTDVVTITEIGGNNVTTLKNYFINAYNNWDTPPAAVLLMADYGTSGVGITSMEYSHPYQGTYITDNFYADVVNSDGLPDIAFARMTAQNAAQLEVMVTKFIDYEMSPPTATDFYDHPITACGWQTERWFQICSETVGGYLKNVQGKNPVRINEIYDGTPGSVWSTAPNTADVVSYFGPDGLGYLPASPLTLGNWSGGNATDVINALNDGAFMLQHRDHGASWGWGEPRFTTTNIGSLTNTDLSFIFSMNCSTGQFSDTEECFAERFHRLTYNGENAGALGLIAATQVSYSFVNDALVFGMYDYMWPDFMPSQNTITDLNPTPETLLPGFAQVNGKYFLAQSNWPYNTSDKAITYNLFHMHGDAFTVLYSEVPQNLSVTHASQVAAGATSFTVTADAGSFIGLTVNGVIIATAEGTGSASAITIPAQADGDNVIVTITKQNYYRYSSTVAVIGTPQTPVANFTANLTTVIEGQNVQFTDLSTYLPTSWSWTFTGGTPSTSTAQNPTVTYNTAGTYQVTLVATNNEGSDTEIKTGYITVNAPQVPVADFTASSTTITFGESVTFTDNSTNTPTSWAWTINGGTPSTSTAQNPTITFNTPGTYTVALAATNGAGTDIETKVDYITVNAVLPYCTSQGNSTAAMWITNVQVGSYSNSSSAAGYTDFTSETVSVSTGLTAISLTPGKNKNNYSGYWKIWIDLNHDGDFSDAGELVFDAGGTSRYTVSGNMNIPTSTASVTTRMRVSLKYGSEQTECEVFSYGEVEDYTVSIGSGDFSDHAIDAMNLDSKSFELYPNPAQEMLNINLTGYSNNTNVKILDINGRIIENFNMEENHKSLNIEKYNSGIYLIVIESGNKVDSKRFIKE